MRSSILSWWRTSVLLAPRCRAGHRQPPPPHRPHPPPCCLYNINKCHHNGNSSSNMTFSFHWRIRCFHHKRRLVGNHIQTTILAIWYTPPCLLVVPGFFLLHTTREHFLSIPLLSWISCCLFYWEFDIFTLKWQVWGKLNFLGEKRRLITK